MRLIIAGSSGLPETCEVVTKIQGHLEDLGWHGRVTVVISGTAKGADKAGELYAARHDIPVELMPADWKKHKRAAGYRRNEAMAIRASHCLVLWDGKSKGARHMIDIARERGLEVAVRRFVAAPPRPRPRRKKKPAKV